MILIGLGANLPSSVGGPRETLMAALDALEGSDIAIVARSRWYRSAPVPPSDQPDYVNGVARLRTALDPAALLDRLHAAERSLGRIRGAPNAARSVDLDLLDYDGRVSAIAGQPALPHPRLHLRSFVLLPLAEIAAGWRHPVSRRTVGDLVADLPSPVDTAPLPDIP